VSDIPEIDLLQPTVFRGLIERFVAPERLTLLGRTPQIDHPFPTVEWEVVRGSRAIARPNVPNSAAHIVPRLGRGKEAASFLYLREKKVFLPTTILWLKKAARTLTDIAISKAEEAVMREVRDLNVRFDNFAEWTLWQSLTGNLVIDRPDVQADVDYHFLDSHRPTVSTSWADATPKQIVNDIRSWKRVIKRDGGVEAREAYAPSRR
jgi:hypothetical protein